MAATITHYAEDRDKFELIFTTTADADATPWVPLVNGFVGGGGYATRSAANAFTTTVEYSVDGVNAAGTLVSLTEAAPDAQATAAKVMEARFVRGKTTTNGAAQTLTVYLKLAS